ncbi:MAG: hypothetical protein LBK23_01130 [Oscillospiraceae bacterium]|jgi:hypothetical protein|nr:hypothetical protein [Oscillospiraceae bacterium]
MLKKQKIITGIFAFSVLLSMLLVSCAGNGDGGVMPDATETPTATLEPSEPEIPAGSPETEPQPDAEASPLPSGTRSEDGSTLVNEWSGISLTLPEGWEGLPERDYEYSNTVPALSVVDFEAHRPGAVYSPPNITITYSKMTDEFGPEEYGLEKLCDRQVEAMRVFGEFLKQNITETGRGTSVVGGAEYAVVSVYTSPAEDAEYQAAAYNTDYYVRILDDVVISIVTTYDDASKADMDALVAAIVPAV